MVPQTVYLVPLFVLMSNLGLVNSYGGLILPFAAQAFGVFLMRQFIQGIPDELLEAARMDGAGEFTVFRRVVLPLLLSHGWPDSFWRYTKVISLLTDPGAHSADPADAFDVVVPDMPGYGYSERPNGPPLDAIAEELEFRTTQDVSLWPIRLKRAEYVPAMLTGAAAMVRLTFALQHPEPEFTFDDDGNALALLHRHVYEEPFQLGDLAPDVPAGIGEVVMRCLAKDPKDRYQTAEDFGLAIADATTGVWGPRWNSRAGLPVIGAHRLRHTVATESLRRGASLAEIAQLLRHHAEASTAIYSTVDRATLDLVVRPWPGAGR